MRQVMRRALGVGGATAVALGAVLSMAGTASAHDHKVQASCTDGVTTLQVVLTVYTGHPNSLVITDKAGGAAAISLADKPDFGHDYTNTFTTDGTVAHVFEVVVKAGDGSQYSFDKTVTTDACKKTPPPSSSSSTAPPSSSSSTAPPSSNTVPPSTSSAAAVPPVTTSAPVAPQAAALANTGVNAGLPLAIAGGLVVIGGGLLVGMRLATRRRRSTD